MPPGVPADRLERIPAGFGNSTERVTLQAVQATAGHSGLLPLTYGMMTYENDWKGCAMEQLHWSGRAFNYAECPEPVVQIFHGYVKEVLTADKEDDLPLGFGSSNPWKAAAFGQLANLGPSIWIITQCAIP